MASTAFKGIRPIHGLMLRGITKDYSQSKNWECWEDYEGFGLPE